MFGKKKKLPKTPYWPDRKDPLGIVHGRTKLEAVENELVAAKLYLLQQDQPELAGQVVQHLRRSYALDWAVAKEAFHRSMLQFVDEARAFTKYQDEQSGDGCG